MRTIFTMIYNIDFFVIFFFSLDSFEIFDLFLFCFLMVT